MIEVLCKIYSEWDYSRMGNFLSSDYFIFSRFDVFSYRSHSWMTLIGSDQLAGLAYAFQSKIPLKVNEFQQDVMFRLGGAAHYTWTGIREWMFIAFCNYKYMELRPYMQR